MRIMPNEVSLSLALTLPKEMWFPLAATAAAMIGFCVVLPYMVVRRLKETKGRLEFAIPAELTEEQRNFILIRRAQRARRDLIITLLLLAILVLVLWRTGLLSP
jgi:hypothetical protein